MKREKKVTMKKKNEFCFDERKKIFSDEDPSFFLPHLSEKNMHRKKLNLLHTRQIRYRFLPRHRIGELRLSRQSLPLPPPRAHCCDT